MLMVDNIRNKYTGMLKRALDVLNKLNSEEEKILYLSWKIQDKYNCSLICPFTSCCIHCNRILSCVKTFFKSEEFSQIRNPFIQGNKESLCPKYCAIAFNMFMAFVSKDLDCTKNALKIKRIS